MKLNIFDTNCIGNIKVVQKVNGTYLPGKLSSSLPKDPYAVFLSQETVQCNQFQIYCRWTQTKESRNIYSNAVIRIAVILSLLFVLKLAVTASLFRSCHTLQLRQLWVL